ncbi:hypothetical protein HC891_18255 [Candidatus Gracilibacteria bacterium]|nr:hypothetical protein [Candidatus Gracilibacteria bacterium]
MRRELGPALIVAVFLLLLPLSTPRVVLSDEIQYFSYLRSLYFDGNLDFRNEYQHFADIGLAFDDPAVFNALLREDERNPNPETGLLRNVAPVGSALLWAPGFVLADVVVQLANVFGANIPRDGFSRPYILAVCMMSALYALLGLLLTYRITRRYVGDFAATLATLSVFLASPLIFYTFIAMPWSHANGFFLFALFLWLWGGGRGQESGGRRAGAIGQEPRTENQYRNIAPVAGGHLLRARQAQRPLWMWLLLGFVGGLMVLTREQLGLLLIIPALEGVVAYCGMLRRHEWARAATLFSKHLAFLVALLITLLPQLAAYQVLNGRPAPAATVGDKFRFAAVGPFDVLLSPHFFDTLLHPAHGAFLWSPVIAIGLLGLCWLGRKDALLAGLLLIGFLCQTYINGAFGTTWHLSRAFGFRRLIECTPIFVLGLAALIEWLRPRLGSWPLLLVAAALVYWNLGLIAQWTIIRTEMRAGLIWDGMLRYQFLEVPGQVVGKLRVLLFDRCKLVTNQTC